MSRHNENEYEQTTERISVAVVPEYLEHESDPTDGRYVWAYHVRIENLGGETVQLLTRYWRITDANGVVQEVRGPGVVGEQPVLGPGDSFEYTSGTPLGTPSGFMEGSYQMTTTGGRHLDVVIPTFSLDSPHARIVLH